MYYVLLENPKGYILKHFILQFLRKKRLLTVQQHQQWPHGGLCNMLIIHIHVVLLLKDHDTNEGGKCHLGWGISEGR
jgi:hypothetical protein